ncbi:hypothetical protein K2173_004588 [Erythroxylum novogranatense]|uniref:non-specific serine/threonine protein kinase n=1 Tax=Erythroxylum novogranatense TaxID=1862640 RepID=A0AAV8T4Z9_9ROSI|nr:hypothetical protein K2173_004588 [Erythroxylum novogranatense]
MGCCISKQEASKPDTDGCKHGSNNPVQNHQQPYNRGPQQQKPLTSSQHVAHQSKVQTQSRTPQPRAQQHRADVPFAVQPAGEKATQAQRQDNTVLGKPFDDIREHYTLGKQLGRGQFGITYLCTEKSTGHEYACKSILKRKLSTKNDREDIKKEVNIMQHLSGQSNIVQFRGAYEDRQSVHLVMELCAGGELFDRIIEKGHYSERDAAKICRYIVNVVHACHFMGVMHRDLKPENFLLSSKDEGATLKATDFGLSVFIEEGKVYHDIVGSAYYVAPEVLRRSYGKEIDIWSAGIILYILLCGLPPFWAENEKGIFDAVLKGDIDFESEPWPSISESAKDLITKMLTQDPKLRITSAQVLAIFSIGVPSLIGLMKKLVLLKNFMHFWTNTTNIYSQTFLLSVLHKDYISEKQLSDSLLEFHLSMNGPLFVITISIFVEALFLVQLTGLLWDPTHSQTNLVR